MKDRIHQQQFHLYWEKGALNMADYFTKHHPPRHHKLMRHKYLQRTNTDPTQNGYTAITKDLKKREPELTRHDCAHATINVRGCVTPTGLIQSLHSTLTSASAQPTVFAIAKRATFTTNQ
jgi:hypothetical protein